jgi:hypothetical protein
MSAHAKMHISIQHRGITSLNNNMPDAVKAASQWLYDHGFSVNEVGEGQQQGGDWKAREYYWIEVESTSCSYDVFDETYIEAVLEQWVSKFPDLWYEVSVYNLDVEPDLYIVAGGAS